MGRVTIDPITRIEGHLKVDVQVEDGRVGEAVVVGTLFRGIELILVGRDPRDAQRLTQRICGVCPTSHSIASTLSLDSAFGLADMIPDNGRLLRNLILGSAHIADHILHFYHLCALDYVDVASAATYTGKDSALLSLKGFIERGELGPFIPRYEGDYRLPAEVNQELALHYVQALRMRRKGQEMLAVFGGKMPHNMAVVPGGVTEKPTVDKIASFLWRLNELREFIDGTYLPDVLLVAGAYPDYFEIGRGCGRYLSYGSYDLDGTDPDLTTRDRLYKAGTVSSDLQWAPLDVDRITEQVAHSWYEGNGVGLHPSVGTTNPDEDREGAYSWVKSPRYDGAVYEVGPLARFLVSYAAGQPQVKEMVDQALAAVGRGPEALMSVLGRHLTRALDAKLVADTMADWLLQLKPGDPAYAPYELPQDGTGMGLIEGARGALGHWVEIKDAKISRYQCVVPSTWNMSPRDESGVLGPLEQALLGTSVRDETNPFELVRIVRSFDPCLACAVHVINPAGRSLAEFRVS